MRTFMPIDDLSNGEEIEQQQVLLDSYRRTLVHLLHQAAQYGGEVYAPPITVNSIDNVRANIQRIKTALRASGVNTADHSDDEQPVLPLLRYQSSLMPASIPLPNQSSVTPPGFLRYVFDQC